VIRVIPLGGLGEIGKNMTVVENGDRILLIDVGLMFPTAEMHGVDLVLPDFTYLQDKADRIEAIVLTHGHEDHVGALPYVLRELDCQPPIYGGALTVGMVRSKLDEHRIRDIEMKVVSPGEKFEAAGFEIETIHMAHSIPDARAVAVHTPHGAILFTGDYRFDQTPVDGPPADMARLAKLGDEGVLCLCGDSTNADRPGVVPSEASVGPALYEVFSRCPGRIVVTCFASNVHRVQQVVDAAARLDRKVVLLGRSMRKNFNIAAGLGIAKAPDGLLIQPREIGDFPDNRVVIVSTGSQGEPLSALTRMAIGEHRDVELHADDTIVFSATPIPGNERAVNTTIDHLYEIGAGVVNAADAPIHVSGHGSREELKMMLNLTRPKYVFPFHGDFKRIVLHAGLAEDVGIPADRIFKGRNGLPLEIDDNGNAAWGEPVGDGGKIYVDGPDIGHPDDIAFGERRQLADEGLCVVVATVPEAGEEPQPPEIVFKGVPFIDDDQDEALIDGLSATVEDFLAGLEVEDDLDLEIAEDELKAAAAEYIRTNMRRRPMVLPVLLRG